MRGCRKTGMTQTFIDLPQYPGYFTLQPAIQIKIFKIKCNDPMHELL